MADPAQFAAGRLTGAVSTAGVTGGELFRPIESAIGKPQRRLVSDWLDRLKIRGSDPLGFTTMHTHTQ